MRSRTGVIVLSGIFLITVLVFSLPFWYLFRFGLDDAYFYIKTANNFAHGLGSTFDTINPTNGYHPLWFLFLAGFYKLLALPGYLNPESIYRATFWISCLISIGTLGLLTGWLNRRLNRQLDIISIISLCILELVFVLFHSIGMETQISLFFLSLYLYLFERYPTASAARSLAAALFFLCRIDYFPFYAPAILFFELKQPAAVFTRIGRSLLLILCSALALGLYFYSNFYFFGNYFTVSSLIESARGNGLGHFNLPTPSTDPIKFGYLILTILGALVYLLLYKKIKGQISGVNQPVILWVSGVLFIAVHAISNTQGIREWYFGIPLFISILLLILSLSQLTALRYHILVISASVGILFFSVFRMNYYNFDDAYQFARKIQSVTRPDEVIFMVDQCGIIGFYSNRQVVNGDGLINGFEYLEAIKGKKLDEYFTRHPFDYYATYSFTSPGGNGIFTDSVFTPGGYVFQFPNRSIILTSPKIHGGLFRKKYGSYYLIKNQTTVYSRQMHRSRIATADSTGI